MHTQVPEELGQCLELERLGLDNNLLQGELPATLGFCSRLHSITVQVWVFPNLHTACLAHPLIWIAYLDCIPSYYLLPTTYYSCSPGSHSLLRFDTVY